MNDLSQVMHIEDEADIREITKIALEDVGGLKVGSCASGEEAIETVLEWRPDMFLIDVMMPGLDGPSTLLALREIEEVKAVPAVFMTANAQVHEIENYKSIGAVDVITKPFDPMSLADDLRRIWEKVRS
jgi:two-component system OmpR family response regulator